ncbi:MAG TPA: amidohydrolase family protein, partial [Puia sp.]|nr:amidohydrolase family protein [Puia sp.]
QGILSPGFVNCHCHLELSHLKNAISEKTGLVDFLLSVIKQRNSLRSIIQQSIADGEEEMLGNGIVAVGDVCNTTDSLAQKTKGNLIYYNFIETLGFTASSAPQRLEGSYEIFKQFGEQYAIPIQSNSIVPHAPYSVSAELFRLIANFPGNHVMSIHNQESDDENQFFQSASGDLLKLYKEMGIDISSFLPTKKRSPEYYIPFFHQNQSLILVHNVSTNEGDLEWMAGGPARFALMGSRRTGHRATPRLYFCLCPNANEFISGKLPDIDLLIKFKCKIVVGTDSLASNHQLNVLEELKTIQRHFPHIETKTLLQWATWNGSDALQLDDRIGSFETGKQPGIILIENLNEKNLTPSSRARRII